MYNLIKVPSFIYFIKMILRELIFNPQPLLFSRSYIFPCFPVLYVRLCPLYFQLRSYSPLKLCRTDTVSKTITTTRVLSKPRRNSSPKIRIQIIPQTQTRPSQPPSEKDHRNRMPQLVGFKWAITESGSQTETRVGMGIS